MHILNFFHLIATLLYLPIFGLLWGNHGYMMSAEEKTVRVEGSSAVVLSPFYTIPQIPQISVFLAGIFATIPAICVACLRVFAALDEKNGYSMYLNLMQAVWDGVTLGFFIVVSYFSQLEVSADYNEEWTKIECKYHNFYRSQDGGFVGDTRQRWYSTDKICPHKQDMIEFSEYDEAVRAYRIALQEHEQHGVMLRRYAIILSSVMLFIMLLSSLCMMAAPREYRPNVIIIDVEHQLREDERPICPPLSWWCRSRKRYEFREREYGDPRVREGRIRVRPREAQHELEMT